MSEFESRRPARISPITKRPMVDTIEEENLDLSPEEFRTRIDAIGISISQFAKMTDITRARYRRVVNGEQQSLVEREPGVFVVPRAFTIILIAFEAGLLTVGEESM
ncbi:MAG: hypothetical protein RIA09_15945 [Hoeflea sp.]|jgi:hypothetical protein|uniref:hypothetical protein n=1 Tax=Hoeflea sp. TaxID=1940281 RepID=UPI0032EDCF35